MSDDAITDWQKGGVRYAKLRRIVLSFLAPERVDQFFIAVKGRGGAALLFDPFVTLKREYVVVLAGDEVVVLRLKRPGVFRAAVAGVESRVSRAQVDAKWRDGKLFLDGVGYHPIAFHHEDAEEVAGLLGA